MEKKELTPQQSFEEKIRDRMRDDIGDLVPDEVLADLMQKAIQEMFFTRRSTSSYGNKTELPSWFEAETEKLLSIKARETLHAYMEENKDEIESAIRDFIQDGIGQIFSDVLRTSLESAGGNIGFNISNIFNDQIRKNFNI